MMKRIAFYISDHGFGHAARNIPIMAHLLEKEPDLELIIKSNSSQIDFIRRSLGGYASRIACHTEQVDVGTVIQEGSYLVDREKTGQELERFVATWETRIRKEKEFLSENGVDLVVSDIVPWVLKVASQLGIRSLLISNFTWVPIYRELVSDSIADLFQSCYELADYVFEYPLAKDMNLNPGKVRKIGMSCRPVDMVEARRIRESFQKPIVYAGLGKLIDIHRKIDVEGLPVDFVYTEGLELMGENAHRIPKDARTQDYIEASDIVITKAGWGTVAEAICAQKPMLVLRRDEISEDRNTVSQLVELGIAKAIDFSELNSTDLKPLLEAARKLKENYDHLDERYRNHSKEIAEEILGLLK